MGGAATTGRQPKSSWRMSLPPLRKADDQSIQAGFYVFVRHACGREPELSHCPAPNTHGYRRAQGRPENESGPPVMAARVVVEEAVGSALR